MKIAINGKQVWVNYHHLYYFWVVVNEGSLANASRILLVGQPSLSSQIRQFEQSVGIDLFNRDHKRLTLSDAGIIAHKYATRIFQIGTELVEALQRNQSQEYKIGISENISSKHVLDICQNYSSDSKKSFSISRGNTDELIKDLNNRQLDLVITNYAPSVNEGPCINVKKIGSTPIIICGSPKYKKYIKDFPSSLESAPFMLPLPGSKLRTQLDQFFTKFNLKTTLVGESKDLSIQKMISVAGMALTAVPLSSVQSLLDSGELIEIGRPERISEDLFVLSREVLDSEISSGIPLPA